jgi:hypothetical protein
VPSRDPEVTPSKENHAKVLAIFRVVFDMSQSAQTVVNPAFDTSIAKRHAHHEAARLAGEVFEKVLNRAADRGGYEYALYCFENGIKSVQEIVLDFICSDEFIDNFAALRDPGKTASLVNKILLGEALETAAETRLARHRFVRFGLRAYAEEIMLSKKYREAIGPNQLPGYGH